MKFLSNGDYIFPFESAQYWAEHVYTWSFQSGAPNPDGIIRLPGRLIHILIFIASGNLAFGYFYVASCLVVAFLTFLWFSKNFLGVHARGVQILGSAFFALNPIFLGNLSKIGLVLAVAMLPLALTALKRGFEDKRFSYFLIAVAALNISLVHPFTFSVNLLVCGVYLIYTIRKHHIFIRDNLHKFGLLIATALLLNAYLILPLMALGTVDKGAISDTVSHTPVNYTSLVDIANTGDIFTALSLSKGVLKDYEFYGALTWPFYFLGVFGFYVLLLVAYLRIEKHAKPFDRRRFVVCLSVFLLLLVLSTASYLQADAIIKWLIGLPGGWMFRSPLKWQLYMPLVLFTALVVAMKYMQDRRVRRMLYTGFAAAFVLMNGYLFTQIYERLLTPRTVTYFGVLEQTDLAGKKLLFVNSSPCMTLARENPALATELNQVLISKDVQVKRVGSGSLNTINLAQYDFVVGCNGTMDDNLLTGQYHFSLKGYLAGDAYQMYQNTQPRPYATAVSDVFALSTAENLGGKFTFSQNALNRPFNFIDGNQNRPTTGLQTVFGRLTPASIKDGRLQALLKPLRDQKQQLFVNSDQPLYVSAQRTQVTASATPQENAKTPVESGVLPLKIPPGDDLTLTYQDPAFTYQNILPNPSMEDGLWQEEVGDCNNHDDNASLAMGLSKQHKTDGEKSLLLQADRHIACTGPEPIRVQPGEHYLLSFDYQAFGRGAGYFAGFDGPQQASTSERLSGQGWKWQQFSKIIEVPPDATNLQLFVYGYPPSEPTEPGEVHYDNFGLTRMPDVQNRFFLVSGSAQDHAAEAPGINSTKVNPAKHLLHVKNARSPFYISTKESYHRLWRLFGVSSQDHVRMNGNMNGWYIDPQKLCEDGNVPCAANADGTYDIELAMEFTPQRWFYIGCLITLVAGVGAAVFVVFDIRRTKNSNKGARK